MITPFARLIRRLSNRCFPAAAPRPLRRGFWTFALLAAMFLVPVVANIWLPGLWNTRAIGACRAAAVITGAGAIACWVGGIVSADGRRDRQDVRDLIRQNADLYRQIPEQDRPPRLVAAGR